MYLNPKSLSEKRKRVTLFLPSYYRSGKKFWSTDDDCFSRTMGRIFVVQSGQCHWRSRPCASRAVVIFGCEYSANSTLRRAQRACVNFLFPKYKIAFGDEDSHNVHCSLRIVLGPTDYNATSTEKSRAPQHIVIVVRWCVVILCKFCSPRSGVGGLLGQSSFNVCITFGSSHSFVRTYLSICGHFSTPY